MVEPLVNGHKPGVFWWWRKTPLSLTVFQERKEGESAKTNMCCLPALAIGSVSKNGSPQDAKVRVDFMGCDIGHLVGFDWTVYSENSLKGNLQSTGSCLWSLCYASWRCRTHLRKQRRLFFKENRILTKSSKWRKTTYVLIRIHHFPSPDSIVPKNIL